MPMGDLNTLRSVLQKTISFVTRGLSSIWSSGPHPCLQISSSGPLLRSRRHQYHMGVVSVWPSHDRPVFPEKSWGHQNCHHMVPGLISNRDSLLALCPRTFNAKPPVRRYTRAHLHQTALEAVPSVNGVFFLLARMYKSLTHIPPTLEIFTFLPGSLRSLSPLGLSPILLYSFACTMAGVTKPAFQPTSSSHDASMIPNAMFPCYVLHSCHVSLSPRHVSGTFIPSVACDLVWLVLVPEMQACSAIFFFLQ